MRGDKEGIIRGDKEGSKGKGNCGNHVDMWKTTVSAIQRIVAKKKLPTTITPEEVRAEIEEMHKVTLG